MESFKLKIKNIKKELKQYSSDHFVWYKLGCAYFTKLKFKKAIECLNTSISLKGDLK